MTEIAPEVVDPADVDVVEDAAPEAEVEGNTGRSIMAIPTATEPIHHIGDASEPKHMTLVWLGKPEENPDLDMDAVQETVRQVAEQGDLLTGTVEKQGPLGEDGAQVVFLGTDGLQETHDALLADPAVSDAVGKVEQFPEWQPHVTLGYQMEEPVPDDDLPEQVIFDRLAVWDGEEHTEFPLGPSAESTTPEGPGEVTGEEIGLDSEFLAALTEAMTKPIAINDAESLAAAVRECDGFCGTAQMATRPLLMKRARELGVQHLIPTSWIRQAAGRAWNRHDIAVAAHAVAQDAPNLFQLKTDLSGLTDTALRAAYVRGVREFAMTAPQSRPPLPRDVVAQARVNSLIRLAQGDLSARTDDRDLLP